MSRIPIDTQNDDDDDYLDTIHDEFEGMDQEGLNNTYQTNQTQQTNQDSANVQQSYNSQQQIEKELKDYNPHNYHVTSKHKHFNQQLSQQEAISVSNQQSKLYQTAELTERDFLKSDVMTVDDG